MENVKLRNDWLEASRRKNYELEHDRLKGELNTLLNKNPNATSIKDLLEGRMAKLKDLANESIKGTKHEIYAKDSTGGHAAASDSSGGDRRITIGFDARYTTRNHYCEVCQENMPNNQRTGHERLRKHEINAVRHAQGLPPIN